MNALLMGGGFTNKGQKNIVGTGTSIGYISMLILWFKEDRLNWFVISGHDMLYSCIEIEIN